MLEALYLCALAKAFLRYRNPRPRAGRRHRRRLLRAGLARGSRTARGDAAAAGGGHLRGPLGGARTARRGEHVRHRRPRDLAVAARQAADAPHPPRRGAAGPAPRRRSRSRPGPAPPRSSRPSPAGRLRGQAGRPAPAAAGGDHRRPHPLAPRPRRRGRGRLRRRAADRGAGRGRQLPPALPRRRAARRLRPPAAGRRRRRPVDASPGWSAQANDERLRHGSGVSQVLLTVDLDMRRTLAGQGLSLRSVPAAGPARDGSRPSSTRTAGADNATATGLLCRRSSRPAPGRCAASGVRLAGIDVITPDPAVPLERPAGVILEVNAPPNYYYHYHKRDGASPSPSRPAAAAGGASDERPRGRARRPPPP